jgi:hypothetical protein
LAAVLAAVVMAVVVVQVDSGLVLVCLLLLELNIQ